MGVPQNGWFIMGIPTKMDDDWGYPYFRKAPIFEVGNLYLFEAGHLHLFDSICSFFPNMTRLAVDALPRH